MKQQEKDEAWDALKDPHEQMQMDEYNNHLGEIESSNLSDKLHREFDNTDDSFIVFARRSGRGYKLAFIEKSLEDLFWSQTPYEWYTVVNG